MGKSSSGKDTIYRALLEARPKWREIVLYTTRPMREGEVPGKSYHFVTEQEMKQLEVAGKVIESRCYDTVQGPWYYATVKDGQFTEPLKDHDYLMIGTLESYEKTRAYFGNGSITPIYLEVPDKLRRERAVQREMQQRTPEIKEMLRRFRADELDFSEENLRHAGIHRRYQNLILKDCIHEILRDTETANS